ncbi:hypothetical protein M9Y10_037947 [Tritrichomonas musculus]|uniref:Transmembrane protein n=1 Tax=Tritrichomonas musculus TaxID=1915356 RepID=A0ABR2K785_9EUKA
MLNSTILGLSTILLAGSPFSMAPVSGSRTFSVDKSLFTRSIHNLFYFNIFTGNAKFSKTTFDNIIGGAIRVDSAYDAKDQVIEKRYAPNIMSQNFYSFESCMFRNCHISGEKFNGGAVSINVPAGKDFDVDISFEFSSFYNCYAAGGQGGALYGYRIGDVSLLETCFSMCFTREQSSTGDTGTGTAVYLHHRASTERTKSRGSSYDRCPPQAAMYPNTESVFYVMMGKVDFDHSNFTNNVVEQGSSAICLVEQKYCNIDFTSCINCIGENTIHIVGQTDASCDINTVNFVNCANHSEAKELYGVVAVLYTQITLDDSVFIMGDNKFLAIRDQKDTTSKITFNKCTFDRAQNQLSDTSICDFKSCAFGTQDPKTNKFTYFDSRECWEINPDRLPASNTVYAFFIFFALFCGIVGFGIYLQVTQVLCGEAVVSTNYDAAPAISEPINNAQYDTLPE